MPATILQMGVLAVAVCVPKDWTEKQIIAFAEREYPCGTSAGWNIRREARAQELRSDQHERQPCDELPDHVHMVLDA